MSTNDLISSLLASLRNIGCRIWVEDGKLKVRTSKTGITAELREQLSANKEEILAYLNATRTSVDVPGKALPLLVSDPERRFSPFPITDIQQAYLLGREENFSLGNISCHIYIEMDCPYDKAQLSLFNRACQQLIERHDMLRAVMEFNGWQRVLEQVPPYIIPVTDLGDQPEETIQARLAEIRKEMSHRAIDPYNWPIFDIRATRIGQQRIRLHITLDMLTMDAWSIFTLYKELHHLICAPETILPPLMLTFRDYVLTLENLSETAYYKQSRDYWLKRLDDLPPAPELPLAPGPETSARRQFNRHDYVLSTDAWERLKGHGEKFNLTPSTFLLAAFAEVLTLWSKSPRFTLNLTLFDRLPLHPQVKDIVGDFTSPLLLEVDNTAPATFSQRAIRIQEQLWEDLSHNTVNGVRVLRELTKRRGGTQQIMPIVFTSTLALGSQGEDTSPSDWLGEFVYSFSQTPQLLVDHQIFEHDGKLIFNWDCIDALFPLGLLDDMFAAYCRLLELLSTDETAWQHTTFHELLLTDQLAQRAMVNDTGGPVSSELLHDFFVSQAHRQPSAPAIISPQRILSYGELLELAQRTAHWLQRHDIVPDTLVGAVMEKGWEQVVAVLGILMAGGAYLPIDAHLPAARRNDLLTDGQVHLALTQPKFNDLEWPSSIQRLILAEEALAQEAPVVAETTTGPEDLAYVIYTSGSTGRPGGHDRPSGRRQYHFGCQSPVFCHGK